MVFRKKQTVCTFIIHVHQLHLVKNTEIITYLSDIPTCLHASNHMHARVKSLTKPFKGLKSTTYRGVFLQHRYMKPLLRKDGSCKEPPKSTAYDDNFFLHLFASIIW